MPQRIRSLADLIPQFLSHIIHSHSFRPNVFLFFGTFYQNILGSYQQDQDFGEPIFAPRNRQNWSHDNKKSNAISCKIHQFRVF